MKLKHGYVNPATGLVFVGYYKSCKNGEWWLDADSFAKRKEKRNLVARIRYATNPISRNRLLERARKWQASERGRDWDSKRKGRPEELAKRRIMTKKRLSENPVYRVANRIRNKTYKVFKHMSGSRSATASAAIGLNWNLLKHFIESQFADGMTWENMGKWHIDHFVPMKLAKTRREVEHLSHYTNLRPMWDIENLKKGDSLPSTEEIMQRNQFIDNWNFNASNIGGMPTQGMQQ